MLERILSHRLTAAVVYLTAFAGFSFVAWRDAEAVEKTKKGWLGVSVQELTPSLREAMKVGNRPGLLITSVVRNSPADDANLKEEDVILTFDGKTVEKADEFVKLVRDTSPDKKVKIKILRDGKEKELEVIIGARESEPRSFRFGWDDGRDIFITSGPRLGVQVQKLNKDLAPYFQVEEKGGVLILEVSKNSPAEKAGLKAGDVITRIGDEKVTDPDDLIEALKDYEEGDKVTIEYMRMGKSEKTQAEIERSESRRFQFFGPGRNEIRIRRFLPEAERDIDVFIPEFPQKFDIIERRLNEQMKELQRELERMPKKLQRVDLGII
ncbi:MAG: PDZ domain-containing protein [candidate division KSB1 bacterium]|nr:PDZ domain-containing protein [candidate division KSB1 bacterium]MDZ7304895.1 PDZ domain-containing protein [candidate division KSB1 bacterium]MDZ7313969.1 PDZ domain-containing protein [candidate division KSB1 bacterium]